MKRPTVLSEKERSTNQFPHSGEGGMSNEGSVRKTFFCGSSQSFSVIMESHSAGGFEGNTRKSGLFFSSKIDGVI